MRFTGYIAFTDEQLGIDHKYTLKTDDAAAFKIGNGDWQITLPGGNRVLTPEVEEDIYIKPCSKLEPFELVWYDQGGGAWNALILELRENDVPFEARRFRTPPFSRKGWISPAIKSFTLYSAAPTARGSSMD